MDERAVPIFPGDDRPVNDVGASEAIDSSKRMPDGNQWTTTNVNLDLVDSYCYEDAESNFGKGQLSLGRHDDGEKQRAFSVRCVRKS